MGTGRGDRDRAGRAFITVDKQGILNMCPITSDMALIRKEEEIRSSQHIEYTNCDTHQNRCIQTQAHKMIKVEGIFAQYDFFEAVKEFFHLAIGAALKSDHTLITILALIDRRIGKRTLQGIKKSIQKEKEMIQYFYHFYRLQCQAEGI